MPNNRVPKNYLESLQRQLIMASLKDMNPYRRGEDGEIISILGANFPEISYLKGKELNFEGDGWLTGDFLYKIAELSDKEGIGIVELLATENAAFLMGLNPLSALTKNNLSPVIQEKPWITTCSFWGPCFGQKLFMLPRVLNLTDQLKSLLSQGLLVHISACPRDCRYGMERCDIGLCISRDGKEYKLWLGGHHLPFSPPVTPFIWKSFPLENEKEITHLIEKTQYFYEDNKKSEETLPELIYRQGLSALNEKTNFSRKAVKQERSL
jgi:hypothetical protein